MCTIRGLKIYSPYILFITIVFFIQCKNTNNFKPFHRYGIPGASLSYKLVQKCQKHNFICHPGIKNVRCLNKRPSKILASLQCRRFVWYVQSLSLFLLQKDYVLRYYEQFSVNGSLNILIERK